MEIEPTRGGFRKLISTREFILDYMKSNGEAYIAEMHRAYKEALRAMDEVPPYRGRGRRPTKQKRKYVYPRYHSFQSKVWRLAQEGLIRLTRTEPTLGLKEQFKGFETPPERHYYEIVKEAQ
jgi:hypothetical protein